MVKWLDPAFDPEDFPAYRREETAIILTSLAVLVALAGIGLAFWPLIGPPGAAVLLLFAVRGGILGAELTWIRGRAAGAGSPTLRRHALAGVAVHLLFAALVSMVAERDHSHYVVLFVLPIIVAAFRFSGVGLAVVTAAVFALTYIEVSLEALRGHTDVGLEYFENTVVCIAYGVIALTVHYLVRTLRDRERRLRDSLQRLSETKEQLAREEGLAAVGRLAASLAHEIRNPIALLASAQTAANRPGTNQQELQRLAAMTGQEIQRLERLTADFLAYARNKPPEPRPASIASVMGAVAGLVQPALSGKSTRLDVAGTGLPEGMIALFDPWQVQQALLNLVLNACQMAPDGSSVGMSASLEDAAPGSRSARQLAVTVSNAGPAVPPASVALLFEPFFSTRQGGTGLGLSIARAIARAHGGDVELRANTPERVEFALVIPFVPAATGAAGGADDSA